MTQIDVFQNGDGDIYTFTVLQRGNTTGEDLTNYTAVTMDIISTDLLTNHGTITLAFVTKASGTVKYTNDTADPYPTLEQMRNTGIC